MLWLREKKFSVFVDIKFDHKTEQIMDIIFRESTR
ncbi:DUF3889 domain-containing protein [Lysinibacillus contaminans]